METVRLEKDKYKEWDDFCISTDDAWFWHTTSWLEYSKAYNPRLDSKPVSFFINDKRDIVAICPLLMENREVEGRLVQDFSYGGSYGPTPALKNGLSRSRKEKINITIQAPWVNLKTD